MPLPHLYILHPPENRLPGIASWLAKVEQLLKADASWDGCLLHQGEYDDQASIDVHREVTRVTKQPGPVIMVQKVQTRQYDMLKQRLSRRALVYLVNVMDSTQLFSACEEAKRSYENGEPSIPLRELIAYLIIRKLDRQGKWGGVALNKNFLWREDLPKGGFPGDIVNKRDIFDTAEALLREGVLTDKTSEGEQKLALGPRNIVAPILQYKCFTAVPRMAKFFNKSNKLVPAYWLDWSE